MIHQISDDTQIDCVFGRWSVWYQCPNGYWISLAVAGAAEAIEMARHGRHFMVVTSPRVDD